MESFYLAQTILISLMNELILYAFLKSQKMSGESYNKNIVLTVFREKPIKNDYLINVMFIIKALCNGVKQKVSGDLFYDFLKRGQLIYS